MERHLRGIGIAGLALAAGITSAAAQDMKSPRISHVQVDWSALDAELNALDLPKADAQKPAEGTTERLGRLNRATGERFANIAASPVPVLLPFDTVAYLRDGAVGTADPGAGAYLSGFQGAPLFHPGPGGYDAVVVARAQDMRELGVSYSSPIYVHISGSALLYELDQPAGMIGLPVAGALETEFPGIKRLLLESYLRYTFVRYGVPYAVAIDCFEGGSRYGKISCREADKVAVRLLKALRLAGGAPQPHPEKVEPNTIERPAALSTVFTYHSPGDLLPGTGFRGKTGVADYTVYSKIRFPMADAPAFANSQSFMNWGNCEATGRLSAGMRGRAEAYRCRVNSQPLISDEAAPDNYSYPWRDNFCEHRFFFVGQCPGGFGHQGQDVRPASCKRRMPGANRCEPYVHDVVAVRDGALLRAPGQEALYLVTNAPNERVRFRYLHMQPKQMDADGMVFGRLVREGELIGKVGNYFKRERATTYHLHFDAQVPTRHGWVFVNPYMTLVASYERLIRGHGQEIRPGAGEEVAAASVPAAPAPLPAAPVIPAALTVPAEMVAKDLVAKDLVARDSAAKPTETAVQSPPPEIDSGMRPDERAERADEPAVTASVPADAGGNANGNVADAEHDGAGAEQQAVRPMGRGFSRPGPRAWNFRRHLHAGDEQHQARHSGL
jgi:hypothetical protein